MSGCLRLNVSQQYDSFSDMINSYRDSKINFYDTYEEKDLIFNNVRIQNYNGNVLLHEQDVEDSIFSIYSDRVICSGATNEGFELYRLASIRGKLDRVYDSNPNGSTLLGIIIYISDCEIVEYNTDYRIIEIDQLSEMSKSDLLILSGDLIEIEGFIEPILRFRSYEDYFLKNLSGSVNLELNFDTFIDFYDINDTRIFESTSINNTSKLRIRGTIFIDENFTNENIPGEIIVTYFVYI
jgi:hypothetical protein